MTEPLTSRAGEALPLSQIAEQFHMEHCVECMDSDDEPCSMRVAILSALTSAVSQVEQERDAALRGPCPKPIKPLSTKHGELLAAMRVIEECLSQLHVPLDTRVNYAHKAATEAIAKAEGK